MLKKHFLAVAIIVSSASFNFGQIDFLTFANNPNLSATPGPAAFSPFGMGNFATVTESGVVMTIEAIGGDQSNTNSGMPEPIGINGNNPVGSNYGDGDGQNLGIGVRGNGSWQINGNTNEALSLSFSTAVLINSIDLNGIGAAPNNNDRGIVTINGFVIDVFGNGIVAGTPPVGTTFTGGATDVINFANPLLLAAGDTILLEGPNAGAGSFSLRGLNVTAVPEPATASLICLSGLVLMVRRRR